MAVSSNGSLPGSTPLYAIRQRITVNISRRKKNARYNVVRFGVEKPQKRFRAVSKSLRSFADYPMSLARFIELSQILEGAWRLRFAVYDPPVRVWTAFELRMLRRFEQDFAKAIRLANTLKSDVASRERLESDLRDLFAPICACNPNYIGKHVTLMTGLPPVGDNVLCTYSQSFHEHTPWLEFYLKNFAVHSVGRDHIVRIPRWLYAISTVDVCTLNFENAMSFYQGSREIITGDRAMVDCVRDSITGSCIGIPSDSILEAVLSLWSSEKTDLYHDLAAALVAAQALS